ncbi:MAG: hypothetical protein JXQ73_20330 [Phycisphaerae bacterium]|nr:hypothetical protein [Phycisphaerae bacterium]
MRRGKLSPVARGLLIACVISILGAGTVGCYCTADWCSTFRDAANPSIQTGLTAVTAGLINGIFSLLNTGSDTLGGTTQTQTTNFTQGGDPNATNP